MKIGFVLDDSLDKSDGVQQYILTLGGWLRSKGHEVHYLVGETHRKDIPNIHSLSQNLQVRFNHNRMSTPRPANRKVIKDLIKSQKFDVLHIQMPHSPFLAGRIIKYADSTTAVVGTFHILPFSPLEKVGTKILGLSLIRNIRRLDEVFSVSLPAQQFAKSSFGVESSVLPNVVALERFRGGPNPPNTDDDFINLVFLGKLVSRKGCAYLLEALKILRAQEKLSKVRVYICGIGPMEEELRQLSKAYRLTEFVEFKGFISEEDKAGYFRRANVAVFPSTGGESFGIVLIEAMAAGAEVVLAGDNPGYRSVLGARPDQLINPADSQAFAETLAHYISDPKARQEAHNWQQQHVKQYDVEEIGARLERDYEILIAKRALKSHN